MHEYRIWPLTAVKLLMIPFIKIFAIEKMVLEAGNVVRRGPVLDRDCGF